MGLLLFEPGVAGLLWDSTVFLVVYRQKQLELSCFQARKKPFTHCWRRSEIVLYSKVELVI